MLCWAQSGQGRDNPAEREQLRAFLEVETPLLSRETIVDSQLDPVTAELHAHRGAGSESWFLQTSPELGMKRLLADLKSASFSSPPQGLLQITKAFRDGIRAAGIGVR